MWRRKQNSYCGQYCEHCEYDKAQSVDDHSGEFPIISDIIVLVLLAQLIAFEAWQNINKIKVEEITVRLNYRAVQFT